MFGIIRKLDAMMQNLSSFFGSIARLLIFDPVKQIAPLQTMQILLPLELTPEHGMALACMCLTGRVVSVRNAGHDALLRSLVCAQT
jgi:hypothetical protein